MTQAKSFISIFAVVLTLVASNAVMAKDKLLKLECKTPFTGYMSTNTLKPYIKVASSVPRQEAAKHAEAMRNCISIGIVLSQNSNPYAQEFPFAVVDNVGNTIMEKTLKSEPKRKMVGGHKPEMLPEILGRWEMQLKLERLKPYDVDVHLGYTDNPTIIEVSWDWTKSEFKGVIVSPGSSPLGYGPTVKTVLKKGETLFTASLVKKNAITIEGGNLKTLADVNKALQASSSTPPEKGGLGLLNSGMLLISPLASEPVSNELLRFKRVK